MPPSIANLGDSASALANITSYKLTLKASGGSSGDVTETLTVVEKPTKARSIQADAGGQTIKVIQIGSDTWVDTGSGSYLKNMLPQSAVDAMTKSFDPVTLFGDLQTSADFAHMPNLGTETKNGVQTVHFHADSTTTICGQALPKGASVDLWVATDGGYLVALNAKGFSTEAGAPDVIAIDVTNINDPSLKISPPS